MGDVPVHLILVQTGLVQQLPGQLRDSLQRELKDLLAVHVEIGVLRLTGAGGPQDLAAAAGAQSGEPGGVRVGLDHCGAHAVAEDDAGGAVVHVGDPAEQLAAHKQGVWPGHPGQQGGGGLHGIEETGAAGTQVKGGAVLRQVQRLVDQAGLGGGGAVGGYRGSQAQPQLLGGDARPFQGGAGGLHGQLRQGFVGGEAALTDAGAADDPLIAGLHPEGQVVVGDDVRRQGPAGAENVQSIHVSVSSRTAPMARNF